MNALALSLLVPTVLVLLTLMGRGWLERVTESGTRVWLVYALALQFVPFLFHLTPLLHGVGSWRWGIGIWLGGIVFLGMRTGWSCWRLARTELQRRPVTQSELLTLLEDAKETLGVTTPLALIFSPTVRAPMLVGWLRPRLLVPTALADILSPADWQKIFLHEVAHLRRHDILGRWLLTGLQIIHWFNPLVWWLGDRLREWQEEATDARVLSCLANEEVAAYGALLLRLTHHFPTVASPQGAVALTDTAVHLKKRIQMIAHYSGNASRLPIWRGGWLTAGVLMMTLWPAWTAEPKMDVEKEKPVVAKQAEAWLAVIDQGKLDQSWEQASVPKFQKLVTKHDWAKAVENVRAQTGAKVTRQLKNQTYLATSPEGVSGPFIVCVYEAVYEKLKARDTVTFILDEDKVWRACGYFTRPAP